MDLSKEWIRDHILLIKNVPIQTIPLKFHMIWVGTKPIPDYAYSNFIQWKELMPHWESKLWINEDINLDHFSQEVIDKINQAQKGAQKADIMRYHIIEKYGGFYLDTDTIAIRSLDPLLYMNSDIILYHDNNLTWNYISNSPFGAIQHHPILKEACKRVMVSELNTSDVHMKTGPHLWGTVVSEVKPENGKRYPLLTPELFGNFHHPPDKIGRHTYAASWVD